MAAHHSQPDRPHQAYSHSIANAAIKHQTFVSPPFKMERMTWIKPSFLWMMYRAGWGFKDDGQNRILAIDITLEGFEWALAHSCLSHRDPSLSEEEWQQRKDHSPVRIQWDPERDLLLQLLEHRAIQIGLSKEAVQRYVNQWIVSITEVTPLAHQIYALVQKNKMEEAQLLLPKEMVYIPSIKRDSL